MFARIKDNQITEYPLTEWDIRERINFFGSAPKFDVLLPAGYIRVQEGSRPTPSKNEKLVEAQPVIVEGKWTRNWIIVPKSPEEIEPVVLSPIEQEMLAAPKPDVPEMYRLVWDEEAKEWYPVLNQGAV
jgi:hypothetical protein